jgi:hypothetical protein
MKRQLKRIVRSSLQWPMRKLAAATATGLNRLIPDEDAYQIFYRKGFHLLRRHFYLPIPDAGDLGEEFWAQESEMIGVEMNDAGALELLNRIPVYMAEFRERFPLHGSIEDAGFYLINGSFMAIDAHLYYSLIRHFRPRRVVEIGSGFSTLLAGVACMQNWHDDGGSPPRLTAIEPYPSNFLKEGFPSLSELIEKKVQDVDLDVFTSLEANDILFIDSTHALRTGGDVQLEFCEILPRLAPGVFVHIHDISLPRAYPRVYFDNHLYWNEQYVLQTFLAFNHRFEIIWPGNYMILRYPERVREFFPEYNVMRDFYPSSEPTSFWMRVRPQ